MRGNKGREIRWSERKYERGSRMNEGGEGASEGK